VKSYIKKPFSWCRKAFSAFSMHPKALSEKLIVHSTSLKKNQGLKDVAKTPQRTLE